jgi:hypothetical protein
VKRFSVLICLLILAFAWPLISQSAEQQDSAPQQETQHQTRKANSPGKNVGEGGKDIGEGVGKGTADLAKGTASGVGDLATGHPVNGSVAVGKGAGKFAKNAGVGTGKGAFKIGKGVGGGLKKLGKKSRKNSEKAN